MKIAIDLDGVCYEWQRTYRYMMREYRGVDMPPVEEFWHYWNAPDQFTSAADRKWLWTQGVKHGLFRYGHMVKGTRLALTNLSWAGHELSIVTHRPKNAVNDTLDWLSLYFKDIPLAGLHIMTNGESKADVDAQILVDDKPENILEWADRKPNGLAICFDQPWNQNVQEGGAVVRCWGWEDVVDSVRIETSVRSGEHG